MAYRDAHVDARSERLAALVASHDAIIEERSRVCREHDDLSDRVELLRGRLAEIERALASRGVVATVKHWLGASNAEGMARDAEEIRRAMVVHQEQLGELVTRERALTAQLAEIEAAREDLVRLQKGRARALRASKDPLGYALRRLDEERAAIGARIALLDRAMVSGDRVHRALMDIRDLVEGSSRTYSHAQLSIDRANPLERDRTRTRLRDHLKFARDELRRFVAAFEALETPVEGPSQLAIVQLAALAQAPFAEFVEHSELVMALDSAITGAARVFAIVDGELTAAQRRNDALAEQQRALESRPGRSG